MSSNGKISKALYTAFPYTIPILAGFLFLGIAYGYYMNTSGFGPVYPIIISATVFAGSMEFVAVNLLLGAFDPLRALILTLMDQREAFVLWNIDAQHLRAGREKAILSDFLACVMKLFPSTSRPMFRPMWTRDGLCFL